MKTKDVMDIIVEKDVVMFGRVSDDYTTFKTYHNVRETSLERVYKLADSLLFHDVTEFKIVKISTTGFIAQR
jgi:hypothetical protein